MYMTSLLCVRVCVCVCVCHTGLTIDYGPYGFLDKFDPFYTPNITDAEGRR